MWPMGSFLGGNDIMGNSVAVYQSGNIRNNFGNGTNVFSNPFGNMFNNPMMYGGYGGYYPGTFGNYGMMGGGMLGGTMGGGMFGGGLMGGMHNSGMYNYGYGAPTNIQQYGNIENNIADGKNTFWGSFAGSAAGVVVSDLLFGNNNIF